MMIAALAAVTLASCSKDNDGGNNGAIDTGEPTYAVFSLKIADSNEPISRGYANLNSTAAEAKVHSVRLYIADDNGVVLDEVDFDAQSSSVKSVQTTVGPKQFFTAVNVPTAKLPTVVIGSTTLTDVMNHITTVADMSDVADITNGFWMTSKNVLSVNLVVANKDVVSADPTHPNNLQIDVARTMAKIGVYFDDASGAGKATTDGDGIVKEMEYRVENILNKMYLLARLDASGIYATPGYDRGTTVVLTDYFKQPVYSATGLTAVTTHIEPSYMMENNNLIPCHGNSTYTLIKTKFVPEASMLYDAADGTSAGTLPANGSFWRIANITKDASNFITITSWEPGFYDGDPDPSIYTDAANQVAYEYIDGNCYYALFLDNEKGRASYSIERNQYWDVVINNIKGVGFPREDNSGGNGEGPQDPNPEKPIKEDVYVDATITVLGWTGVEMDGDLEGTN